MRTPRIRSIVSRASRAAALGLAVAALAACGHTPPPDVRPVRAATIRFDNEAPVPVYVYLVAQEREWRLGRVEAGGRGTLRLPAAAPTDEATPVRLAVVADRPASSAAARDARATFTIAQPTSSILFQRWTYAPHQSAAPTIFGQRATTGRR